MQTLSVRLSVAALFATIAAALPLAAHAVDGPSPCKGGAAPHLASQQEADSASPKGSITAGVTYVCPDDARLGISNEAGAAKEYLRTIVCTGSQFGGTTPDETVNKLDAKFAVCAASFLKAMSSQLPGGVPLLGGGTNPVCLREGFRTVAQQEKYAQEYRNGGGIACTKGAGCEHPRGIAIDVNTQTDSNYQKMWDLGPQFGVNFYLRSRDKVHFVPAKTDCSAGGINPGNFDYPQYYTAPSAPSSPFANAFRQALGMPSQPSVPSYSAPTTNPTTQTLPQPTQSNFCLPEYQCSGNTLTYKNSFCAVQTIQQCSGGCVNGACVAATSTSATSTSGSTSTVDVIGTIGGVTATTTPIGTSTPLSLILAITQGERATSNTNSQPTVSLLAPGSVASQQYTAQQTFMSPDITGAPASSFDTAQKSALSKILDGLKTALLWALNVLRPFQFSQTQVLDSRPIAD